MTKPQLEKAIITVLDGADKNKVITVLFNPAEYSVDRSNSYKALPVPGLASPILQFVNGECDQLSMELFLDDYTDPTGPTSSRHGDSNPVAKRIADLFNLLEVDRDLHAPPPVRFNWGPMEFVGIIEKLTRKVTKFYPDGTPARATVTVAFKEYRTLRQQLQRPRRESADKTKRRIVVGSDTLWAIAAREYDDPSEWVRIADANDLDDPRQIRPGDWLELPPMENADGTVGTL
jgi:nucleoid-associated protein YgaU